MTFYNQILAFIKVKAKKIAQKKINEHSEIEKAQLLSDWSLAGAIPATLLQEIQPSLMQKINDLKAKLKSYLECYQNEQHALLSYSELKPEEQAEIYAMALTLTQRRNFRLDGRHLFIKKPSEEDIKIATTEFHDNWTQIGRNVQDYDAFVEKALLEIGISESFRDEPPKKKIKLSP